MRRVELESVKILTGKKLFLILSFVEGFWINKDKQHIIKQLLLRQLLDSSCGCFFCKLKLLKMAEISGQNKTTSK